MSKFFGLVVAMAVALAMTCNPAYAGFKYVVSEGDIITLQLQSTEEVQVYITPASLEPGHLVPSASVITLSPGEITRISFRGYSRGESAYRLEIQDGTTIHSELLEFIVE